jgi:hypothetical protein
MKVYNNGILFLSVIFDIDLTPTIQGSTLCCAVSDHNLTEPRNPAVGVENMNYFLKQFTL